MFLKFSPGLFSMAWRLYGVCSQLLAKLPGGRAEGRQRSQWCPGWASVLWPLLPEPPRTWSVAVHWMFSNWTKTLLKIPYAELNGLPLLTASEASSQRPLEFCHCTVLLIFHARRGKGVHLLTNWTSCSCDMRLWAILFCCLRSLWGFHQLGQGEGRNHWKVQSQEASTLMRTGCETLSLLLRALTHSTFFFKMEIVIALTSQGHCETHTR